MMDGSFHPERLSELGEMAQRVLNCERSPYSSELLPTNRNGEDSRVYAVKSSADRADRLSGDVERNNERNPKGRLATLWHEACI